MTAMISTRPHLFGYFAEDLVKSARERGIKITLEEARRVQSHILENGKTDFLLRNPIKKTLQKELSEAFEMTPLKVLQKIEDPVDPSVRYLFQASDGAVFEAVRIPLGKPGHFSVCLSSQAGCAMACDFCATGRLGLKRNLEPWEIVAQLWQVRNDAPGRVTGAVFMGQGEPFHNYDNVIRAAKILCSTSGCRIQSKNITISTVGITPMIRRYTSEKHPFRLIVSLTSAIQEKREKLMPIAKNFPLGELAEAVKDHAVKRRERVTLAWVFIKDFNSGMDEVTALKNLMGETKFKLNLIDVNDARPDGYLRADDQERKVFYHMLQELRVPVVRRYSVGSATNSACGMLAGLRQAS